MIHLLLIPSCLTFLPDFWQSGAKSYIAVKCYILFLESWQRELATSFFAVFRNTLVHPKHPLLNEVLHMTCHSSESVNLYGSCNWKESQKWLIDLSPCTVLCFRHKLGCFSCIYYKFTCSSLILSSCSFNQKLFNMTLIWHLLVFKFIYKKKKIDCPLRATSQQMHLFWGLFVVQGHYKFKRILLFFLFYWSVSTQVLQRSLI